MNSLSTQLDEIELANIDKLLQHPVVQNISNLDTEQFFNVLLQRRFVSHAITNLYDLAIDSNINKDCKLILRRIQREEYPDSTNQEQYPPSHREDLVHDLQLIGISLDQILQSRPSKTTKACIDSMLTKMLDYGSDNSSIKTIAFIRFAGEVLVAEEYKALWFRIAKILVDLRHNPKSISRFFWPHIIHDSRSSFSTEIKKSKTHSSYLGFFLSSLINSDSDLSLFKCAENEAVQLKCLFYDQFIA
jgi:hypothetical protein